MVGFTSVTVWGMSPNEIESPTFGALPGFSGLFFWFFRLTLMSVADGLDSTAPGENGTFPAQLAQRKEAVHMPGGCGPNRPLHLFQGETAWTESWAISTSWKGSVQGKKLPQHMLKDAGKEGFISFSAARPSWPSSSFHSARPTPSLHPLSVHITGSISSARRFVSLSMWV